MFNRKVTVKLLFVLLLLLVAGSVPAPTAAKTLRAICFDCNALDQACRDIGGTPVACIDLLLASKHVCTFLAPPSQAGTYVNACQSEGGIPIGSAVLEGGCAKVCL
jgi:hypothetical protein